MPVLIVGKLEFTKSVEYFYIHNIELEVNRILAIHTLVHNSTGLNVLML